MITSRVLPPEEWPRLAGTEAEEAWPYFNPETTRVIVVEEDGQIIITWTLLLTVHAECLWVDPKRRSFSATRKLLVKMREIASEWGATKVVTGSISPHVTDLIKRFGGIPMSCESFILPVYGFGTKRMRDLDMGRAFHRQLAAQTVEGLHPDDERHDEEVGKTLRTAIQDGEPERAMAEYNEWAVSAGYEPIKYLGMVDGRLRADIVTAVIEVDDHYGVHVVERETAQCL